MTNEFKKALKDFVDFEDTTSVIYPWDKTADEILKRAEEIFGKCNGSTDTESIYSAITEVLQTKLSDSMK